MSTWLSFLTDGGVPVLPDPWSMTLLRHLGWALVLACVVWHGPLGLSRLPPRWRVGLALVFALAALVPGAWGLSYWLGLSFQSPSLLSIILAAAALVQAWRAPQGAPASAHWAMAGWSLLAVVAGWLLLLDTLALLPAFIYPWGYGRGAVWLSMAVGLLLCWPAATRSAARHLLLVLAVFAATRLPTGNLWDALLDPWLWLVAHGLLLKELVRALRARGGLVET